MSPERRAASTANATTFDDVVLPHLDAAYRLARWLLRNQHDAEDAVQEASVQAVRHFRTFTAGNGRAWFLTIVRHTCYDARRRDIQRSSDPFDEEEHSSVVPGDDPESLLLETVDVVLIRRTLNTLPDRFRELLVLRELDELSYRELAGVLGIPIGTVMSGVSRARQAFRVALEEQLKRCGVAARMRAAEREEDAVLV
jgi:RNA polymerase sigma-70 factor (ECF subfamily)